MNLASPPLSDFTPHLPESLVTDLSALNIRTAPDFIFAPPADLLRKLPAGSITFPELTRHIAHVRNAFAGPVLTGGQLIGEVEARAQLPSVISGVPALDGLVGNSFGGGASGGRVVEISGASTSGKTVRSFAQRRELEKPQANTHFCDNHRRLHCTPSCITSRRTRPTPRFGSTRRVTSLRRVSPRSHRVRVTNQFVRSFVRSFPTPTLASFFALVSVTDLIAAMTGNASRTPHATEHCIDVRHRISRTHHRSP
jgi:hypothetical protein